MNESNEWMNLIMNESNEWIYWLNEFIDWINLLIELFYLFN